MPTAYAPGGGSSKPATARRNASGTCTVMPAPSPEDGSAPAAPRWSRLRSAVSARLTIRWLGTPAQVGDERDAA